MVFLKHPDEQSIVSEPPEYADQMGDSEGPGVEDPAPRVSTESTEDMADWFASDEAGFWMSL